MRKASCGGSRGWRVEFSQPFKNKQCFQSGEGRKFSAGKVVALTKVQSQEQLGMSGIGPQGVITEARVPCAGLVVPGGPGGMWNKASSYSARQ